MLEPGVTDMRFKDAVRKRPGMYWGNGAPTVIPAIAMGVLDGILELAPNSYKGPISITFQRTSRGERITFFCTDLVNREFVHKAASPALRRQWNTLEKARERQIKAFHKKLKAAGQMKRP